MSDNLRGAIYMMIALGAYTCNDAAIKLVAPDLGLYQSIAVRGVMASALLAGLCAARGALWQTIPRADRKNVAWRVFAEVGGTVCFLTALLNAPLASVSAVLQIVPLAVTLAAAFFLGDPLGWRRLTAILIAFGSVMLIIRPGAESFDVYSLYALGAVGFIILRDITTRQISPRVSGLQISLLTSIAITVLGFAISGPTGWEPMPGTALFGLALAACFILLGYVLSIAAMRHGHVAFVAPFRYTVMVWAIGLGYFLFDEVPDPLMLLGLAIVIGMGLYAFARERKLARGSS